MDIFLHELITPPSSKNKMEPDLLKERISLFSNTTPYNASEELCSFRQLYRLDLFNKYQT